jgi:signal transduction histidine kinase
MREQDDKKYTQNLEERVKYLEEVYRSTLGILDMMVTFSGNLSRSPLDLEPAQIFNATRTNLERLYAFNILAFFQVTDDDHDFRMAYCSSESDASVLQAEVDIAVANGNFAWAIRKNRSVLIASTVLPGKKLVFHSLATKSRVVGMFVGVLSGDEFHSGDISADIFSILMYNCAQTLENTTLYKELQTANEQLKSEIQERIQGEEHRRKLEHEVMQQSRLSSIGLLTAGIAHNLRSPLTSLMGYISLMQNGHSEANDVDKMMNMAKNMDNIINTMMVKSRRSQETQKVNINLSELLSAELSFLEADMEFKHRVRKEYDFQESLPSIHGLYSDFSQGLMNIVQNAVHAMHDSKTKKLTVKTSCDGENIYVSISDTGCGIPEEDIPHLFSPFFSTKQKLDDKKDDAPTGTGLGLYSSYHLLQPYCGKIDVKSHVGKGTTFTVTFPLAECDKAQHSYTQQAETMQEA